MEQEFEKTDDSQQQPSLDEQEIKHRQEAFNYAKASVFLEGFELSPQHQKAAERFIKGEINLSTLKLKIDKFSQEIIDR